MDPDNNDYHVVDVVWGLVERFADTRQRISQTDDPEAAGRMADADDSWDHIATTLIMLVDERLAAEDRLARVVAERDEARAAWGRLAIFARAAHALIVADGWLSPRDVAGPPA